MRPLLMAIIATPPTARITAFPSHARRFPQRSRRRRRRRRDRCGKRRAWEGKAVILAVGGVAIIAIRRGRMNAIRRLAVAAGLFGTPPRSGERRGGGGGRCRWAADH